MLGAVGFFVATLVPALAAESASGLDGLQGKWSAAKTNREGQPYAQTLDFKKDKLTFQVLEPDKQVRFMAKATAKTEKAGPLNVLVLSSIEAGRSEEELAPVDDSRTSVYTFRGGKLIIASNFDMERENERPGIDAYDRVEVAKEAASAPSDAQSKLLGNWKMVVSMGEDERDYDLRVAKAGDKLEATVISPRSGEHKARSVTFKDNELVIEVDREIEGNNVTFVYKAKLNGEELSGTATARGFEDQFTGKLKARK